MSSPMYRWRPVINDWQNRITSLSDFPFGLKFEPPFAPPIGRPVRLFLKICSNPRNFSTLSVTFGMEAHPALVRADRVVELDPPGPIGPNLAAVVLPGDAEDDRTIGLGHPFEDLRVAVPAVVERERDERLGDLADRLVEFGFARVSPFEPVHEALDLLVCRCVHVPVLSLSPV